MASLHHAEEKHRAALRAECSGCRQRHGGFARRHWLRDLEKLWLRRLVYAVQQAACATYLCNCHPVHVFVETFMEQVARAGEEPILQQLKADPHWRRLRQGSSGRLLFSQELKSFVHHAVVPLCLGPAGMARFFGWLAPVTPVLSHMAAAAHSWIAVNTAPLAESAPPELRPEEDALLVELRGFSGLCASMRP